ncbi:uroporphyrinogen-III synthase [Dietzia aerolata]|uniref:uroporphyrinogen-III synthase n=1 Tax=Dietzia aerolata TaxID=595984 RepID=UPI0036276644
MTDAANNASAPRRPAAPDCPAGEQPLRGRTIAVTAARRSDEQRTLLERRGATVVHAPAMRMIPVAEDERVRSATERTLAAPADLMVLTTAAGVRWWLQVCEEWGLADELLELMGRIPLYSRGPKVTGAIRAAGLREHASAASEATPNCSRCCARAASPGRPSASRCRGPARAGIPCPRYWTDSGRPVPT